MGGQPTWNGTAFVLGDACELHIWNPKFPKKEDRFEQKKFLNLLHLNQFAFLCIMLLNCQCKNNKTENENQTKSQFSTSKLFPLFFFSPKRCTHKGGFGHVHKLQVIFVLLHEVKLLNCRTPQFYCPPLKLYWSKPV